MVRWPDVRVASVLSQDDRAVNLIWLRWIAPHRLFRWDPPWGLHSLRIAPNPNVIKPQPLPLRRLVGFLHPGGRRRIRNLTPQHCPYYDHAAKAKPGRDARIRSDREVVHALDSARPIRQGQSSQTSAKHGSFFRIPSAERYAVPGASDCRNKRGFLDAHGVVGDRERKRHVEFVNRFLRSTEDTRRQRRAVYRMVLSPEDARGLDLKDLTTSVMGQIAEDAGRQDCRRGWPRSIAIPPTLTSTSSWLPTGRRPLATSEAWSSTGSAWLA